MYTQILCTKKCVYQKNGRCVRNSLWDNQISFSVSNECIFYKKPEESNKANANHFWSDLSQRLFL